MSSWKTVIKPILIGIPIGVTVIDKVGYIARVDGKSMQPLFNPGNVTDYIFLYRWTLRRSDILRGDVISFISPRNPDHIIVKRVIGISGDTVQPSKSDSVLKVPEGHCWVEGDHVGHSMDSHYFGPVSLGLVTAKATAIVWPPSRWQRIKPELRYERLPQNLLPLK